jgi:Uma2 family endonuclease
VPTLVLDPPPADFAALLERRRQSGADRFDEVWDGVRHMGPAPLRRHADLQIQLALVLAPRAGSRGLRYLDAFNIGGPDNFRIPDAGVVEPGPGDALYLPTARVVVEVLSPNDETYAKFPFYVAHNVQELLVVDPDERRVRWFALQNGGYGQVTHSTVLDLSAETLVDAIDWPA